MPLTRDPLDDLKNYKSVSMNFKMRNRVLKPEEKEAFIKALIEDITDAKQMRKIFTVVEKGLEALSKGIFLAI